MTDKQIIRRSRRAKQIANTYELLEFDDWIYCIKEGATEHHWRRVSTQSRKAKQLEHGKSHDARLDRPHVMIIEYAGSDAHVAIPSEIEGLPVLELHNKVFYENRDIVSVTMPNTILDIGLKVFGRCRNLEELRFSDELTQIDSATLTASKSLKRIHLPSKLETLDYRLLSNVHLESLTLPASLRKIDWQTTNFGIMSKVFVDSANPLFSSDGIAVYSKDGTTLIKALVETEAYTVQPGCIRIGNSAFKGMSGLTRITFCNTVELIEPYSFFNTGITGVALPDGLKIVDDFAFSMCGRLSEVQFNENLERIGTSSFSKTAIERVDLPASLRIIEENAFEQTRIDFRDASSFCIDERNQRFFTDGLALYSKLDEGLMLLKYFTSLSEYAVNPNCRVISKTAFAACRDIERVELPEGVRVIDAHAFEGCENLTHAKLADSIVTIGEFAFARTGLKEISLGSKLRFVGKNALCVGYMNGGSVSRSLGSVEVDEDNDIFSVAGPLLIQCLPGSNRAIACTGNPDNVFIPRYVNSISNLCFAGCGIRSIELHDGLKSIEPEAFHSLVGLERLHIAYENPLDGFESVSIVFPGGDAAAEGAARSIAFDADGRLFRFSDYDSWVIHYWLLNKRNATTVARMIFARFDQPVKLSAKARHEFRVTIKSILSPLCREFIKHRDLASFEKLIEYGFIDANNIDRILHSSERADAPETTAYLLDAKRRKFGISRRDFSL